MQIFWRKNLFCQVDFTKKMHLLSRAGALRKLIVNKYMRFYRYSTSMRIFLVYDLSAAYGSSSKNLM